MSKECVLDPSSARHRALKRLIAGHHDIQEAWYSAKLIAEEKDIDDGLFYSLNCASVICYARPFVPARGFPSFPNKYGRFESRGQSLLHHDVINFRNKLMAHSDADVVKITLEGRGVLFSQEHGKLVGRPHKYKYQVETQMLSRSSFPLFQKLCEFQKDRIGRDIEQEIKTLFPNA